MRRLKIYLADLIHNRHIYNYCVPLNIGYISARLKQRFGGEIEASLYKFPDDLITALKTPPDILALSNYDWNVNLNRAVIQTARAVDPGILVVMGGPNIRKSQEGIRQFLLTHQTDMYVLGEGEDGFCEVVKYVLGGLPRRPREFIARAGVKLPNAAYLENETKNLILGGKPKSSEQDPIPFPSPWLSGFLDSYLNENSFPLSPLVETNRGCPYQCYYCTWGDFSTKKVRKFDLGTVIEELRYIFKKADHKFNLAIADANFGILERDIAIAEEVRRLSDKYKNVERVFIAQAKDLNRNLKISKILGKICVPEFAVQTLTEGILDNVGRRNVSSESIRRYVAAVNDYGEKVLTDVLVGLPGETKESYINSMKKVIDFGFYKAQVADIRLLRGSRIDEEGYRKKHGIESRFRVIPSAYGEYGGAKVIEYEECIRKTNTMSMEDFLELRLFNTNFFLLYYIEFGRPLLDFSEKYGLHPIDLISLISRKPQARDYPVLYNEVNRFIELANNEWYESEEKANDYYFRPEIFEKIMKEGFPKLSYEYAADMVMDFNLREEFLSWTAENIKDNLPKTAAAADDIARFCAQRIYCLPLDSGRQVMELPEETFEELKKYIYDDRPAGAEDGSTVKIKFDGSDKKAKALKVDIERNGGDKNLSLAIQVILQKNQRAFFRDPVRI